MMDSKEVGRLCEESGGRMSPLGNCEIETKSNTGIPLRTSIDLDSMKISARWREPPNIKVIGKEKGESERKLEAEIGRDPVMLIWKSGKEYDVDFFAGAQRGSFKATKDQLTRGRNPAMKKPYLASIGLDKDLPIVQAWLKL